MKQVFSCSDFLNDLWQNSSEIPDALQGLQSPDEGGMTSFNREPSADMLNLLEQQETESEPTFGAFTACSTSGRGSQGTFTNNQSNNSHRQSPNHSLLQDAFMHQPASLTFHRSCDPQDMQPLPKRARTIPQAAFPMDTAKQAKAICHNGASITALQQQLQDLKGHPGLDSLAHHCQPSMSTALQEPQPQMVPSLMLQGASDAANPAPSPLSGFTPTAATQQPPLGLQQHQLRQLAQLLGTANVSALQTMAVPSVSQVVPDVAGSSIRMPGGQLQECATSSAPGMSHSSGDDDTGALGGLHNLAGLGDDAEEAWEHKLDKNLPPPEMKRMRRMLSNRESARRSRRRKQAHMQDLEVQNNELVELNDKLQKEVTALHNMAKEAVLEKKKCQAALEAFKHQVVHVLGEHNIVLTKNTAPQAQAEQAQQAQQAPAGTADSAGSESMQLVQNTVGSGSPSSNAPLVAKATGNGRATHKLVKVPSSTRKVGSKRKACDV